MQGFAGGESIISAGGEAWAQASCQKAGNLGHGLCL